MLEQCLASLDNQVAEPGQLEVVVIDNGSTDSTPDMLRDWQRAGEHRRVVVEPRVGVVNARNASLHATDREILLYVDDDALVPAAWARAHLAVYESDDRAGSVGGPVSLFWPDSRPDWITDELTQWFSALDFGDESGPFPTIHGPYGTNMSIRRTAAIEAGGFDRWLGRSGASLLSGEEPDLTRRLRAAGWNIVYTPSAAVVQQVIPERMNRRWLLRRGWAQGVSNARLEILAERPDSLTCFRRSIAELGDSARRWWRRQTGSTDEEELASLIRVLAHTAAGVEYLRVCTHIRAAPNTTTLPPDR
jgi:glycosyltransferase involved in cell wall biosynthesis